MSYPHSRPPHQSHSNVGQPGGGNQPGGAYPPRNQHQQHPPQQQLSRTTSVEENQNGQGQYNNSRPLQFSAPQTSLPTSIPQINQFGEQQKQQLWARPPQQPPSQAAYPQQQPQYIYFPQNSQMPQSFGVRSAPPGTAMPYYPQAQLFMSGARQMGPFPLIQASPQYQHPQLHLPEGSTVNKLNTSGAQSLYSVEAGPFPSTIVNQSQQPVPQYLIPQQQYSNVAYVPQGPQGYFMQVAQMSQYEPQQQQIQMQPVYPPNIPNGGAQVPRQPVSSYPPAAAIQPPVVTPVVSPQPTKPPPARARKILEIVNPETSEKVQLGTLEDKLERPQSAQQSSRNSPLPQEPADQSIAPVPKTSPRPSNKEKPREAPSEDAQKFLNEVSRRALESTSFVPAGDLQPPIPVSQPPLELSTEESAWPQSNLNPAAEPFKSPGGTYMNPDVKEFVPGRTPPQKQLEPPRLDQRKNKVDLREEMTPNSTRKIAKIVAGAISFGDFNLDGDSQSVPAATPQEETFVPPPYTERLTPEPPKTSLKFSPPPEEEISSSESKRTRETPERSQTPSNVPLIRDKTPDISDSSTKSQVETTRELTPTPKISIQPATPSQPAVESVLSNGATPEPPLEALEEFTPTEVASERPQDGDSSLIAHMEGLSLDDSATSAEVSEPLTPGLDALELLTPETSNTPVIFPVYNELVTSLEKFWTRGVFNPNSGVDGGEKKYSREFMELAARLPESNKRHAYIEEHPELFTERRSGPSGQKIPRMLQQSASTQFFQPGFFDQQGNRGSPMPQQMQYQQRPSQSSRDRGYAGRGSLNQQKQMQQQQGRPKQGQLVINRPSLVQDVKLRTAEHAWKPGYKADAVEVDPEEAETMKLYKKVRGILNRITPQSFDEILNEYFALNINDETRLRGVIDIFFDKTVEEPNYCSMYGQFCHTVCQDQLEKSEKSPFRNFLLNKCQREFDREKNFEETVVQKQAEIEKATEEEKKKLTDTLNDLMSKEKRRTLGTIKFIGELYLHSLLTAKIMTYCITKLARAGADEEMTECLCKLLTTIGKKLDEENWSKEKMEPNSPCHIVKGCYNYLENLLNSQPELSSRVKFMIKDLFDLRGNRWEPRNKDKNVGPVKIDDLHRSIQKEKLDEQVNLQLYEQNRKSQQQDNRGGQRGGGQPRRQPGSGGGGGGGQFQDDHGSRGSIGRQGGSRGGADQRGPYQQQQKRGEVPGGEKIEQKELSKHLKPFDGENIRLGPSSSFGKRGVAKKPVEKPTGPPTVTRNAYEMFADGEPVSHDSPQTSRESSRSRRDESPSARDDSKNISLQASPVPTPSQLSRENSRAASPDRVPMADIDNYAVQLLDEFVVNDDVKDALRLLNEQQSRLGEILSACLFHAVDKTVKHREQLAKLISSLVAESVGYTTAIMTHIANFISTAIENEAEVDSPKIWIYLGQILAQIFGSRLDANHLAAAVSTAGQKTTKILVGLLEALPSASLSEFLIRCQGSRFLLDHLQHPDVAAVLGKQNLQGVVMAAEPCLEESIAELDVFMRGDSVGDKVKSSDDVITWLENVPLKHRSDPKFVGAFVKHVCINTVTCDPEASPDADLDTEAFEAYCKVFIFLMQGKRELEIAAIDSIGLFVSELSCPKGLLLQIFESLEYSNSIPVESFMEWHEAATRNSKFGVLMVSSETKQWHDQLKQKLPNLPVMTSDSSATDIGAELSGKRTSQTAADRSTS